MRSGGAMVCYRWKMLRRSWRPAPLRDLEGSHSLLELPEAAVPSEMGSRQGCFPSLHHLAVLPPLVTPPKKKFSGISLRRELFPHCWDFLFLAVEDLAPRLGVSVGRTGQYRTGNFILGEITANRIQPQMMRMRGRWKRERIFQIIHKQKRKVWTRGQGDEEVRERAHLTPIHALLPFHPHGRRLHRPLCGWYAWIICQKHSWIVAVERYFLGTNMRGVRFQISQSDYWRFCLKYLLKPGKYIMQVFARRADAVHKLLLLLTCSEPWHCTFGEPALAGDSL